MRPSAISLAIAVLLATPALAQTPPPAEPPPAEEQPAQAPDPSPETAPPGAIPPSPETVPATATPPSPAANPAAPEPKPIVSKGEITLYGLVEFLAFYDNVQNFGGESAGNVPIPRDGTFAADHSRLQFSPRGSRFGLRLTAPEYPGIKVTGQLEADFVGNQFAPGAESGFFTSPTLRIRHFWGRISTSVADLTFGQTWQLFGWIPSAVGYSVLVPGLPGELYTRNSQVRLSRVVKGDAANIEVAIAAMRPPQRDSGTPDGQAGVRVLLNKRQGMRTPGPASPVMEPMSLGVSGIARRFEVPEFVAGSTDTLTTTGFGVAVDVMVPIIPPTSKEERVGALSMTGEFVYGEGISDQYTALTGGMIFPASLPDPDPDDMMPAPAYTPNVDNGMVALTLDGSDLEAIKWTSAIGGLQFYVRNNLWLAANASYLTSSNIDDLTPEAREGAVYKKALFVDGVVGWDITTAARVGLEVARFQQTYVDDEDATSIRVQFGSWYMF